MASTEHVPPAARELARHVLIFERARVDYGTQRATTIEIHASIWDRIVALAKDVLHPENAPHGAVKKLGGGS